jgi:hypothetical protein
VLDGSRGAPGNGRSVPNSLPGARRKGRRRCLIRCRRDDFFVRRRARDLFSRAPAFSTASFDTLSDAWNTTVESGKPIATFAAGHEIRYRFRLNIR